MTKEADLQAEIDRLQGELAEAAERAEAHGVAIATLNGEMEAVRAQLAAESERADANAAAVDQAQRENAELKTALEKAEATAKAAKAKVERTKTASGKPRVLKVAGDRLAPDDLELLIADAAMAGHPVEIAFADGDREVAAVPRLIVSGPAWKRHALGLMLGEPIEICGPAPGAPAIRIDGYALLIDGEVIAFTRRHEPVGAAPGQRISLADDIYF
ncbi:MAG: hypothetical protein QHC65_04190 [Sphingomonas sp.]|nr:hypothetical protein [Sphingomonas sp.]MDX3883598.1 hypothetical protein [Sphingomonas sp.]